MSKGPYASDAKHARSRLPSRVLHLSPSGVLPCYSLRSMVHFPRQTDLFQKKRKIPLRRLLLVTQRHVVEFMA